MGLTMPWVVAVEDLLIKVANVRRVFDRQISPTNRADLFFFITHFPIDQSVAKCNSLDGTVLNGRRKIGQGMCAIIRDPAGAVAALYQPAE